MNRYTLKSPSHRQGSLQIGEDSESARNTRRKSEACTASYSHQKGTITMLARTLSAVLLAVTMTTASHAENLGAILLARADITTRCAAFYDAASEAEGKIPGREGVADELAAAYRKSMDDAVILQEATDVKIGGPVDKFAMDRKVAVMAIEQFQSKWNLDTLIRQVLSSCNKENEKTHQAIRYVLSKIEPQEPMPAPRPVQRRQEQRECPGLLTGLFGIKPLSCEQRDAMMGMGIAMMQAQPAPIQPAPMIPMPKLRPIDPPTVIWPLNGGGPTIFVPVN
jgi:hypothetical protein